MVESHRKWMALRQCSLLPLLKKKKGKFLWWILCREIWQTWTSKTNNGRHTARLLGMLYIIYLHLSGKMGTMPCPDSYTGHVAILTYTCMALATSVSGRYGGERHSLVCYHPSISTQMPVINQIWISVECTDLIAKLDYSSFRVTNCSWRVPSFWPNFTLKFSI